MNKLRPLTKEEVETFASRPEVKRIAVENFLFTVAVNPTKQMALANLRMDARLYRWNEETVRAIADGIELAATRSDEFAS